MPRSTTSKATTATVDSIIQDIEDRHGDECDLDEFKERVRRATKGDKELEEKVMDTTRDPRVLLSNLCLDTSALVSLMVRCGAVIAGPQATSCMYNICSLYSWPWDIFCNNSKSDYFIDHFIAISGSTVFEDISSKTGHRVVFMRRPISGYTKDCIIRIFSGPKRPMECVLDMSTSYEQSVITPVGAVCFWPELNKARKFRVFLKNKGFREFPIGKSVCQFEVQMRDKVYDDSESRQPQIISGLSKTNTIIFKNTCNIDAKLYDSMVDELRRIIYCTHKLSTRYLGHISGM